MNIKRNDLICRVNRSAAEGVDQLHDSLRRPRRRRRVLRRRRRWLRRPERNQHVRPGGGVVPPTHLTSTLTAALSRKPDKTVSYSGGVTITTWMIDSRGFLGKGNQGRAWGRISSRWIGARCTSMETFSCFLVIKLSDHEGVCGVRLSDARRSRRGRSRAVSTVSVKCFSWKPDFNWKVIEGSTSHNLFHCRNQIIRYPGLLTSQLFCLKICFFLFCYDFLLWTLRLCSSKHYNFFPQSVTTFFTKRYNFFSSVLQFFS